MAERYAHHIVQLDAELEAERLELLLRCNQQDWLRAVAEGRELGFWGRN
jgi:hypothetical protein